MQWLYVYYFALIIIRFVVAHFYNGFVNDEDDNLAVFVLTVFTDILLYMIIYHTHASTNYKDRIYHIILYYSTSCVSLVAFSRSLSHAWITFLLVAIKLLSLYQMHFYMMMVAALGMFISFHDQTILFIVMCWSLFIERWILFTRNDQSEGRMNKLLNCSLLIILSIYAYYNGKQLMLITWICPPWMTYYDLFFILHIFSVPSKRTDNNHWQPWYILKDQALPLPFIGTSLDEISKKVRYLYSSFEIQWFFVIIFWLLYIFPPIVMVMLGDVHNKKIQKQFVSSTMGLLLIMVVGREIAIDAVDKLSTKSRRIHLFLTWLLVNIGILVIYYYIYLFTLLSTFYHHYCFRLPLDFIEYAWLFALISIGSLCRSKKTITDMAAVAV